MARRASYLKGISVRYRKDRQTWRVWCEIKGDAWAVGSYPTVDRADQVARELERRLIKGEDIRPAKFRTAGPSAVIPGTVREVGDRWLVEGAKNRKGPTNDFYDGNLQQHIYPLIGDLAMTAQAITRARCEEFARDLIGRTSARTKRPLAYHTRVGILRTFSSLCAWARGKYLEVNPADRLLKFTKDPDELPTATRVWTHAQADLFLRTVQADAPHLYVFFLFAIRTGLRAGELIELRWADFAQLKGAVLVARQYQVRRRQTFTLGPDGRRVKEKNDQAPTITPLKGRQARRVAIRPELQQILDAHRKAERAKFLKLGDPQSPNLELVFTGPLGARMNVGNLERRDLAQLCEAAGVPATTKLHTTRHTFATVLLAAGEDLEFVSQQLGHKDASTTERHYKHWIQDDRRDTERGARIDAAWRVEPKQAES